VDIGLVTVILGMAAAVIEERVTSHESVPSVQYRESVKDKN